MAEVELSKNEIGRKPSIFGMIFSPNEQFERIRERPVVLVPLLIILGIAIVMAILVGQAVMNYAPSAEELGLAEEEVKAMESLIMGGAIATTFLAIPFGLLISTLIYFAIAKIAKSQVTFKQMFSLSIFVGFIGVLGQLINSIVMMALNTNPDETLFMPTSLNGLVNATGALGGVLSAIEIFSIWGTILLALGLHKVAGLSKKASWIIVIVFFIIGVIFAAIGGAANELLEGMNQL